METYLIDGMRFEGLNENSEGWFGGPADKLLMVDSIKLIKGYTRSIIHEKFLRKIHVDGG